MRKISLILSLVFVSLGVMAQSNNTSSKNTRSSNYYDDFDFDDETFYNTQPLNNTDTSSFSPDAFILDDSDGVYTISIGDEPETESAQNPAAAPTAATSTAAPQQPSSVSTRQPQTDLYIPQTSSETPADETEQPDPVYVAPTLEEDYFPVYTDSEPKDEQPVVAPAVTSTPIVSTAASTPSTTTVYGEPELVENTPADAVEESQEDDKPVFNGEGHHLQVGFGGGWSRMITRVSEDLGTSRLTAPAFTGNISYFYYPLKWIGVGTGLHLSHYKGDILMNPDAVRVYDKYVDAQGAYRFIEDPDGDRYRHRVGLAGFNEIENIHILELPLALQFKYKFADIAGIYTTLGVKIGMPIIGTYKVKSGLVEHYGYYGQYDLTLRDVPGIFGSVDYTNRGGGYNMGKQLLPVCFAGYAEIGAAIRLTEKLDLLVGAYFNIGMHDISMARRDADKATLGFNSSAYNYPWMNEYAGLIGTDMVGEIRPYNVGIKATIDFNYAPKKQKKDKEEEQDEDATKKSKKQTASPKDTIHDTIVIIHDTIIYRRVTTHFEYDSVGYDEEKERQMREYMDANSENPYLNGTKYRAPGINSYNPADGYDYIYNKEALEKGRKYSKNLRDRNEALSGDEQEMIDYLSQLSIRFQLDRAYPPFVVPRRGINVVAATLKQNPDLVIAVNGHACRLGTERYNRRLALRRARNVAKLLKLKGVSDSQMLVASYGSHVPSAYGDHNLSKDRRVEIVLLGSMNYEQREAYLNKFAEQIQIQTMINEGKRDNSYDLYTQFSNEITVQKGSSLAKIAKQFYGDPDYWVYIYEANSDIIANPNLIEPGTVLMVPDKEKVINGRDRQVVKHEARQLREYYLKQIGYTGDEL